MVVARKIYVTAITTTPAELMLLSSGFLCNDYCHHEIRYNISH